MAEQESAELVTDAVVDDIALSVDPDTAGSPGDSDGGTPNADLAGDREPTAPVATPPASTALGGGQPAPAANVGPVEAPDTLRAEIKEMWPTLDPKVKDEFIKREQDFRRGMDQVRIPAALGQSFTKLVEPYSEAMQQYGVNPYDHINNLMQAHAVLMFGRNEQKLDIINGLCQDAGINLRALVQGSPQPFVDPSTQALQHELAQLRGQVSSVTGRISQEDAKALERDIWSMGEDTANYPFFWDAAPTMVELFRENPRLSLKDAYDRAVVANPVVRQRLIDAEANKKMEQARKAGADKARNARRAVGVRVRSSTDSGPAVANGEMDLDAALRDSLNEIRSR